MFVKDTLSKESEELESEEPELAYLFDKVGRLLLIRNIHKNSFKFIF